MPVPPKASSKAHAETPPGTRSEAPVDRPASRRVGAYEAKTHLPALLQIVRRGGSVIITHRGEPIAELRPPARDEAVTRTAAAAALQVFMTAYRPVHPVDIRSLMEEGRD